MKALQVLRCVKPGLDTAIAHYVNACILLECNPGPFAVGADFQTIEQSFHHAIGHGQDYCASVTLQVGTNVPGFHSVQSWGHRQHRESQKSKTVTGHMQKRLCFFVSAIKISVLCH